jgi:hypothetical protein
MNEDYLWDGTGEPDPETRRLEELLGTLRYEPRPLVIPKAATTRQRRGFVPALAIAATIALAILAAGVWFASHRKAVTTPSAAITHPVQQKSGDVPRTTGSPGPAEQTLSPRNNRLASAPHSNPRNTMARGQRRQRVPVVTASEMSANEMAVAKDQLMLALRVASAKLNFAQRRTQTTPPPSSPIRNQHRIG